MSLHLERSTSAAAVAAVLTLMLVLVCTGGCGEKAETDRAGTRKVGLELPAPETSGGLPLNEVLKERRSRREFQSSELTTRQVSQLLWAAQGITDRENGFRTAPSAGALYPLEIYVLQNGVLRHYLPGSHSLEQISPEVDPGALAAAAQGQESVSEAPAVFVLVADFERTRSKYGDRAERYVYMEAGHTAQNLLLEVVALGLGAVSVGAFDDSKVKSILKLPAGQEPLYLIPVGYAAD